MNKLVLSILGATFFVLTAACSGDGQALSPPVAPTQSGTPEIWPVDTATPIGLANTSGTAPATQEFQSPTPLSATATPVPVFSTRLPRREPTKSFDVYELEVEPKTGTVFEKLLSLTPDNEITRNFTSLTDVVGVIDALGLPRLPVSANAEQRRQYLEDISNGRQNQSPVPLPAWPSGQWDYRSRTDWYPDLAFDFASVEAFAFSGGSFFTQQNEGPLTNYEVALGRFDPEKTAAALAKCDCEQPKILEYAGVEYFLWGPGDRTGTVKDRFKRPFYDHIGRGPYLLIRDGEAFYSVSPGVIDEQIDVFQGTQPSLLDAEGYRGAMQWMASTGIVSRVFVRDSGFTVNEVLSTEPARTASEIQAAPLLLPFEFVATGFGYDGGRMFTTHVIFHETAASATANRERLLERLGQVVAGDSGAGVRRKWSELIDDVGVKTADKYLIVRIYYSNPANAGRMVVPNTLLVHE